uniref:Uncharacterized protein n=1 Tax=Romanomermis culicivorax TaxID=13658 RepID=A0A915JLG6_ROMCU
MTAKLTNGCSFLNCTASGCLLVAYICYDDTANILFELCALPIIVTIINLNMKEARRSGSTVSQSPTQSDWIKMIYKSGYLTLSLLINGYGTFPFEISRGIRSLRRQQDKMIRNYDTIITITERKRNVTDCLQLGVDGNNVRF